MVVRSRLLPIAIASAMVSLSTPLLSQRDPSAGTPERQTALVAVDAGPGNAARLVLRENGKDVGAVAVPAGVTRAALDEGIAGALWHRNGRDVVAGFTGDPGSFVVVFLEQPAGGFRAVDVSRVELANIGVIGPSRTYTRRRTRPVEWRPRNQLGGTGPDSAAPAVQVLLQTRVWDQDGIRYTAAEPLIITRDGTPFWR